MAKTTRKAVRRKTEWTDPLILLDLKDQLRAKRYHPRLIPSYISSARQFLKYLAKIDVSLQDARPRHLTGFLDGKLEQSKRRLGRVPKNLIQWRRNYTSPIHRLLRMVHPVWPPPEPPATECERFQRELHEGYGRWLTEINGLSQSTLRKNAAEAWRLLDWLQERGGPSTIRHLDVSDLDAYLAWRAPKLRRATRQGVSSSLRSFLRYLYAADFIPRDLSLAVSGPILYQFDDIPRAFTQEQVDAVLDAARRDRTPGGLRDHAVLLLLARYGLRSGEACGLHLEDIDWKEERLRVKQSKSGRESFLPLLPHVGDAILKYLQKARPTSELREVFLGLRAPYGPLKGGCLNQIIGLRLKQAGVEVQGRRGAHAFRFARAGSLLGAKVPLKMIGDLLGHRSLKTTAIYLRIATDELRAISLELPREGRR